jgi:uncharacterized glyoxalase superfamily protein PhnB
MNAHSRISGASVIPTVRYRDVPAAVAWLQEAFGFEAHRLVKDSKGSVLYAELTFGTGMVMVAPIQESPLGKLMVQPDEIGGVETQICYLFVADTKAHHARAKAAGADFVLDIEGAANGSRGYSCRDLEGHLWNFGTHNPWNIQAGASNPPRSRGRRKVLAACLLLLAGGAGLYLHEPAREAVSSLALGVVERVSASIEPAQARQTADNDADGAAQAALREAREQLAREQNARAAVDRHVKELREQLVLERRGREAAELAFRPAGASENRAPAPSLPAPPNALSRTAEAAAAEMRGDLAKLRSALHAATEQLAQAQRAREAAERGAKDARDQFAQLQSARETADTTAREMRELAARERSARIIAQRTLRKAKESPYTPYPLQ